MTRAKTVVSAGVNLYINGKKFGRATNIQYEIATPHKAIMGIDCLEPFELAPIGSRVNGKIGLIKTVGDGGLEGQGLSVHLELLPTQKYISIVLIEQLSDTTIFQSNYCIVTGQSWSSPSKSTITGMIEFEALDWQNEFK